MPRSINKIKVYFYIFSLIVLSSILNVNISDNLKKIFLVEILEVNNHSNDLKEIMYNQIEFTLNQNILNLDQSFINQKLNNLKIFETIEVKKKYPNKLVIFSKKTDFIAIGFKEGKKYYVGNNSNLIPKDLLHTKKNLPIIVKCVFEHWDCLNISFDIAEFKNCSDSEIRKYVYIQQEKQFEFRKGNQNYAMEKYTSLSERKDIFWIK